MRKKPAELTGTGGRGHYDAGHTAAIGCHYRLRRSCEVAGIDLQDSGQRLLAHLQIRLWTESAKR